MGYATEAIYRTLKEVREKSGLSQRELIKRFGGRQSHLSKIENGETDLRLSTLTELARALNLEVTLVPRRLLPAVEAIIRKPSVSVVGAQLRREEMLSGARPLVEAVAKLNPERTELAEAVNILAMLRKWPNIADDEEAYHSLLVWIKRLHRSTNLADYIARTNAQLKTIQKRIVHSPVEKPGPAYTLDEEDDSDG